MIFEFSSGIESVEIFAYSLNDAIEFLRRKYKLSGFNFVLWVDSNGKTNKKRIRRVTK